MSEDTSKAVGQEDSWDEADKQSGGANGFLTIETGDNKFRVMSRPAVVHTHWIDKKPVNCVGSDNGCKVCGDTNLDETESRVATTFLFYVLDPKDGKVKVGELKPSVYNAIREYQKAGEYAYTSDVAPYGVTVRKTGSGLKTEYKVIPDRQNSECPKEAVDQLAKLKTIKEVRDKMIAKRESSGGEAAPVEGTDAKELDEAMKSV